MKKLIKTALMALVCALPTQAFALSDLGLTIAHNDDNLLVFKNSSEHTYNIAITALNRGHCEVTVSASFDNLGYFVDDKGSFTLDPFDEKKVYYYCRGSLKYLEFTINNHEAEVTF